VFNKPGLNSMLTNNAAPLAQDGRATITTAEAAHHLNRRPQTLRIWACMENGPIRPVRVNGRLAWPVADILRVLAVPSVTGKCAAA
jgi:hypothetical protein